MPSRVKKLNLSDHTLDISARKCDYKQFDFSEVEPFVLELTGSRDYQYNAIKEVMIYLWGGGYSNITDLAKQNYRKPAIQQIFQSKENFLGRLPLPNRLSGVVHMATGTGKSYVMFAVAYLSIILGKVKRVLVLGPSSTVIESGLRGKFKEHLYGNKGHELQEKLPLKYRNIPINLLDETQPIEDNSIVIENINSIWYRDRNSIGDTLFSQAEEVLVLSDEVHHAYSHLTYTEDHFVLEEGGRGANRDERLWMKFIREEPKIKRHIGFTGTPYNKDEYFVDVIFNYSIKDAIDEKVIKNINPIIHTEAEGEDARLTQYQKFEQILITHDENRKKYSYCDGSNGPRLKPITIFINAFQKSAEKNKEEFITVLCDYLRNTNPEYKSLSTLEIQPIAREKVICVISKPTDTDYQAKLDAIEELNPDKPGGKVEFVFAVNKLSEGWDVDNVYQIVPMQERVFKSKLLISQVLGRGLRLPREVPLAHVLNTYPVVTITNHEKFAGHIAELVAAVTNCETRFISRIIKNADGQSRGRHNFDLFNIEYLPTEKIEDVKPSKRETTERTLILTTPSEKLKLDVTYLLDEKKFALSRDFYTLDQVVSEIVDRFALRQFETKHFDFGGGIILDDLPTREDIEKVIRVAMDKAGFKDHRLSGDNRRQIDIFFNQFLPRGRKRVIRLNVEGNITGLTTEEMDASSARSGELDRNTSIFISEDYADELEGENKFVITDLAKRTKNEVVEQVAFDFMGNLESEYIRPLINTKQLYVVNTSMFKTPQNLVILSHKPERDFVFQLIENSKYIDSWVKSRDMGFYSLDYEYFKGGKDRTRRSFNPDFFIYIDLKNYLERLRSDNPDANLQFLFELQDQGITEIIRSVEIKSDEDRDEVTRAKARYGGQHFEAVNRRLRQINPIDLPERFHNSTSQYYTFELFTPENFNSWFHKLRNGILPT